MTAQEDVPRCCDPRAGRLLKALPPYDATAALPWAAGCASAGTAPELVAAALTQSRLRSRRPGRRSARSPTACCSPPRVSSRPPGCRWPPSTPTGCRRAGATRVVDLGCGIGVDAIALVELGLHVLAVDLDPLTAAVARGQPAPLGPETGSVTRADVTELEHPAAARRRRLADPARRPNGRRLLDPQPRSPPLSWVLGLRLSALGVKVAPGLDLPPVSARHRVAVVSSTATSWRPRSTGALLGPTEFCGAPPSFPSGAHVTDTDLPTGSPAIEPVGLLLLPTSQTAP